MLSGRLVGCACSTTLETARPGRAWREIELFVLVLLVLGLYFSRLTDLTIRGEESRWARVAQEMLDSGDWIVPRQQGDPFPDRPPLNSWAMMLASKITGRLDLMAVRLPATTATLLTTLLIYLYGRNFLSRLGAFAAASAYPTMAQVLSLGRLAESDSLLTLFMTAALFAWHYGYARRNSPPLAWTVGYALAALAGMAKGPQGPIYFVAITTVFLCIGRDWRFLFNRWHLAGVAVFALLVGAWQLPFMLALGPASARAIWSEGGALGQRFEYHSVGRALGHWGAYPFEVLASTMPWSFMLLVLPSRWFRSSIAEARPMAAFLATACAVSFPTCWLPADSRARYFMSLYPCLALLLGLAIQRCWESERGDRWQRSWHRFQLSAAGLILIAGAIVVAARLWNSSWYGISQSVSVTLAVVYAMAAVVAASAVLWSRRRRHRLHAQVSVVAVAGFMGLTYCGLVMNMQLRTSNDPSAAVAVVRDLIPPGDRLVSFGPVHHLFAFYFQQPIELRKASHGQAPTHFTNSYFCFVDDPSFKAPEILFQWERVAEISCERARSEHPLTKVVVGRRKLALADVDPRDGPDEHAAPNSTAISDIPATHLDDATVWD